jgi:hypothetical protein
LKAAEARISAQAEMQAINEELLSELEKRDQAIDEAMEMIARLEAKVEQLEEERNIVRSFDAQYSSQIHHKYDESTHDLGTSQQQHNRTLETKSSGLSRSGSTTRPVTRMPSFLSDKSEGAEALRSLYLPGDSRSLLNLTRLDEENGDSERPEEVEVMNSPRLSVLSESSFLSVYGEKTLAIEALDLDEGAMSPDPVRRRHRKSLSIEKWVDERANSPRRVESSKVANLRNGQFASISSILESPLQRLERLERTLSKHNTALPPNRLFQNPATVDLRGASKEGEKTKKQPFLRKDYTSSSEDQEPLPPTPDTIGTNTLRGLKNSNETLDHRSSERETERSQLNHTRLNATTRHSHHIPLRPHSAGETITSRREGHGWDTATQSEVTQTNSEGDAPSISDPWIAMGREKTRGKIPEPALFTFGESDEEDDDEWGRDMFFNRDSGLDLPPLRPREHRTMRTQDPMSEDTIKASPNLRRSHSTYEPPKHRPVPVSTLSTQSSPNPPDRRSSLAMSSPGQEKQSRKAPPYSSASFTSATPSFSQSSTYSASITATPHHPEPTKRTRISSKLFSLGRSESYPTSATAAFPNPNGLAANPVIPAPSFAHAASSLSRAAGSGTVRTASHASSSPSRPGVGRTSSIASSTITTSSISTVGKSSEVQFGAIQSYNEYARAPRARRNYSVDSRAGFETLAAQRGAAGIGESATPPPIARTRTRREETSVGGGLVGLVGLGRPLTGPTAGSRSASAEDAGRHNGCASRGAGSYDDGFGIDGAGDERESPESRGGGRPGNGNGGRSESLKSGGVKKWFGLGGGLRR